MLHLYAYILNTQVICKYTRKHTDTTKHLPNGNMAFIMQASYMKLSAFESAEKKKTAEAIVPFI